MPQRRRLEVLGAAAAVSRAVVTAAIFAAALVYYFAFVRPRRNRYWTVPGAVTALADAAPAQAVPDPGPTA